MPDPAPLAVILAAGRGTRMQHHAPGLLLEPEQERPAAAGLKALIPFHGHPFLSYTLNALAGFDPDALVARGNIPAERIAEFALVTRHDDGTLARIVEKPDPDTRRELAGRALVSMTCWRFEPGIFAACRAIAPSPRGEYELPDAVAHAVAHLGARFRVIPVAEPVLDLSRREDIPAVSELLRGREVVP